MPIIKKSENEHLVYEHAELGILVAITKDEAKAIKKFWKQYKGKKDVPNDTVKGHPFVFDEEQESLKIDFASEGSYEIKFLQKFD